MSLPRKLLVATDFSGPADEATEVGLRLAERFSAELHFVHAYEAPPPQVPPYALPVLTPYVESSRRAGEARLAKLKERAAARGLASEVHGLDEPPAVAVAECAREIGADWVVIGSRGHTGLAHLLLGSVAERTVELAPCSVLAVREEGSVLEPGTIVLGDDFSESAAQARTAATELAAALGARLLVVHALDLGIPYLASAEVAVPTQLFDESFAAAKERLERAAQGAGVPVENRIVSEKPSAALCEAARQARAGLVVAGSHGRTGLAHALLGSVAERTLRHAPCSVLVVRAAERA